MHKGTFMLLQRCTKALGEGSRSYFLCWKQMIPRGGDPEILGPSAAVVVSKQQLVTFVATSQCRASLGRLA